MEVLGSVSILPDILAGNLLSVLLDFLTGSYHCGLPIISGQGILHPAAARIHTPCICAAGNASTAYVLQSEVTASWQDS